jgi:hypothetical protein
LLHLILKDHKPTAILIPSLRDEESASLVQKSG